MTRTCVRATTGVSIETYCFTAAERIGRWAVRSVGARSRAPRARKLVIGVEHRIWLPQCVVDATNRSLTRRTRPVKIDTSPPTDHVEFDRSRSTKRWNYSSTPSTEAQLMTSIQESPAVSIA